MSAKTKRTAAFVDEAGALEAIKGVASQALPADIIPTDDDPPEAWATYVNSARGKVAAAVVEWGRRIAAAHVAYKAQGQSWGRTWDDWCRDNLGIGERHANRLRMIGENLGLTKSEILPAAHDQLYALARLRRDHPDAFDAAVAARAIAPGMTREQTQALLLMAKGTPTPAALPSADKQPVFTRWRTTLTLATEAMDRLQAAAVARNCTIEDLAAELLEKAVHRISVPE